MTLRAMPPRGRRIATWLAGWSVLAATATASAAPHDVRLPLRDGRLSTAELTDLLPRSVATKLPKGSVDLRGLRGSLFVAALNKSLGDGCRVELTGGAVVLHVDPDKLPRDWDTTRLAVRTFTATAAPDATAAQARLFGLHLPKIVDPTRPLVVVIHGLDMAPGDMAAMDRQLAAAGYPSADFDYPPDGPLADDVALFTTHMAALRQTFPTLNVDVIGYSMGGLIARGYVEGDHYDGGVDRLFLVGTPNHGSTWYKLAVVGKLRLVAAQAFGNGEWHPTWVITGGLCEAGRDLDPASAFLAQLNSRPRRDGVRYTIVRGDQDPVRRIEATAVAVPLKLVPAFAQNWPGLRQARAALTARSSALRDHPADGDGPVSLRSAALDGVTDVVVVHADHSAIYRANGTQPPPAWAAIAGRLATGR